MCTMSMVMDVKRDEWARRLWEQQERPFVYPNVPTVTTPAITTEEIREFRELLDRARQYDRDHNEPDCELDEKRVALRNLAKQLGVEIAFI